MEPTPPPQHPVNPDREPQEAAIDPELPILVRPAPSPKRPTVITTVRVLTWIQVVLVMICGNCSFGWTLFAAFAWVAEYFDLAADPFGFGMLSAWAVGLAAISTYAYFVHRWSGRADRRAQTTIIIGTAVLVACTVGAAVIGVDQNTTAIFLIAAAPSLIVQAIVLGCAYSWEGRRWFATRGE